MERLRDYENKFRHFFRLSYLQHRNHRSYARRSMKKGDFSADFHPILWSDERFCRPLKNCSFEVNYLCLGWRSAYFLQSVLSPKIFAGPVPTYMVDYAIKLVCTKLLNNNYYYSRSNFVTKFKSTNNQGCKMVYFHTKNRNFYSFWNASEWKILVHFMVIWYILLSFGIVLW
jgi:hypothetical protein